MKTSKLIGEHMLDDALKLKVNGQSGNVSNINGYKYINHNHTEENILDLDKYTKQEIDDKLINYQYKHAINIKEYEYLATYDTVLDVDKNWTVALQAAINAAAENGNTLFIPNGTYKFSNVTIPNMLNIVGEHRYRTILKTTATSGSAIYFSGTVGDSRSKNRIGLHSFTLTTYGGTEAVDFGIKIDSSSATLYPGYLVITELEVYGFQKASAVACYIDDVSHLQVEKSLFSTANGGTAFKVEGTTFNTGVYAFSDVVFGSRLADNYGFVVGAGSAIDSLSFNGCYFAGKTSAEKIGNGNNNIRTIVHTGCHFENSTNQAGNCLVEIIGGSGVGGIGLSWRNCSFGGFGNCENAFKFNTGFFYNITIEECEVQNIKSTGYVVNNLTTSYFKNCKIGVKTLTTTPTLFANPSFIESSSWIGGWTINDNGFTDFQKGLKVGGARVSAQATMPNTGTYAAGDYVICTAAPVESGSVGLKKILVGWKRITPGNTHVLNTDWFACYALTGN